MKRVESGSASTYTITAVAGSNGTISPSGSVSVSSGSSKTFTITPNSGYKVADVKADGVSKGPITTYTFSNVTDNHTIEAQFAAVSATYQLSVTVNSPSGGTVASSPAGINCGTDCSEVYSSGTIVTLTATPNTGYVFSGWSDGGCTGTGTCTVTINVTTAVTATFTTSTSTEAVGLIRQNCTGYPNCYTSLSAWEAAYGGIDFGTCTQGDLVCANKVAVARIEGPWTAPDTTPVVIDGWTTDASRYIRIYTAPDARHQGKWSTDKYRLEASGDNIYGLLTYEGYVTVDGLQVKVSTVSPTGWVGGIWKGNGVVPPVYVSNCIVQGVLLGNTYSDGIGTSGQSSSGVMYMWNNIAYGFNYAPGNVHQGGFYCGSGTCYAYNNTSYGNNKGFSRYSGTFIAVNNISYNNTDNYYGTFTSSTNNLSGPSQTDAPGTNARNGVTVTFVDAATNDFHLATTDTGAKDYGAIDPASGLYSTDIDGQPRSEPWDIGADEAATGTPVSYTIWPETAVPAQPAINDGQPIEVGVKFRSDVSGYITGLRFYKGAANTGTHTATLWTSTGTPLATATFTNETPSGWQQVNFASPVAITANTTYVASYYSPSGYFAVSLAYFTVGVDAPPLHALANGVDGGNGVYKYGDSGFPTQTLNSNNYWVDVVFQQ
ncbi:MAG: DUF4082 domain-containing protein [Nitrospirota bacterium]